MRNWSIRIVCHYASCNSCCIMHSTSACAHPELIGGGGGWSCMLLLHPILTGADAGPDLCTKDQYRRLVVYRARPLSCFAVNRSNQREAFPLIASSYGETQKESSLID